MFKKVFEYAGPHKKDLYQPLCIRRIKKLCQLYSLLFCRFQLI